MNIKKANEMREKYDSLPSEEELYYNKIRKESVIFIKEIETEIEEVLNKIYNEGLRENKYCVIKFATEDILIDSEWGLNLIEDDLKIKGYKVEMKYSVLPMRNDNKHELDIEIKW